ncbi:substrate-binding domain-containing protein [Mesorhizobium sp. M00.F.Ca.ET.216.01.1.1]|nr:substrate-binding domain-containing protein [Mesorhizobium sp. M00.F.Ca.ET.216.01.1.1]
MRSAGHNPEKGDVSLVCFDDLDWMQFVAQGITAIAQPAHLIGATAAELL